MKGVFLRRSVPKDVLFLKQLRRKAILKNYLFNFSIFHRTFAVQNKGFVAQLVEQLTLNQRVWGSSPHGTTKLKY